jgi:hypothetical protein
MLRQRRLKAESLSSRVTLGERRNTAAGRSADTTYALCPRRTVGQRASFSRKTGGWRWVIRRVANTVQCVDVDATPPGVAAIVSRRYGHIRAWV